MRAAAARVVELPRLDTAAQAAAIAAARCDALLYLAVGIHEFSRRG